MVGPVADELVCIAAPGPVTRSQGQFLLCGILASRVVLTRPELLRVPDESRPVDIVMRQLDNQHRAGF